MGVKPPDHHDGHGTVHPSKAAAARAAAEALGGDVEFQPGEEEAIQEEEDASVKQDFDAEYMAQLDALEEKLWDSAMHEDAEETALRNSPGAEAVDANEKAGKAEEVADSASAKGKSSIIRKEKAVPAKEKAVNTNEKAANANEQAVKANTGEEEGPEEYIAGIQAPTIMGCKDAVDPVICEQYARQTAQQGDAGEEATRQLLQGKVIEVVDNPLRANFLQTAVGTAAAAAFVVRIMVSVLAPVNDLMEV